MDRALLALTALLINAALGGPRSFYEKIGIASYARLPGKLLRDLERKLNREHRSVAERQSRGLLLTGAVLVLSLMLGFMGNWIFTSDLKLVELILLIAALPVRPSFDRAVDIRKFLLKGNLPQARAVLENTSWRHHAVLDEYGLARAAIELLCVAFCEKILSPIFWYLLLGLPGLLVCKAITLMQETLLRPGAQEVPFAKAAQHVHDIIHYLPSRLNAFLWLVASLFLGDGKLGEATFPIARESLVLPSQKLTLFAAASVLRLTLGGPASLYAHDEWFGHGRAKAMPVDIGRTLYLFGFLQLLLFLLLGLTVA